MATNVERPVILLKGVRLSFPHLFTPHSMEEGQEKKFSASFLLDYTKHAALIDEVETAINRIALDYWKKKIHFKGCLRDGAEKPELDGYEGCMFIPASNKRRPAAVDRMRNPVTEEEGILYAGCFVNGSISLWVQDNKWGKRVNAELRGVQFVEHGEAFGAGAVDPEKEFDALDEEAGDKGRAQQRHTPPPSGRASGRGEKPVTMDDF